MLQLNGVAKHFGSLKVLQGIDLEANAGELVGLIGPTGAGKTTLMRRMSDGAERSAGTVVLCDDIRQLAPERCVHFGLGRSFQTNVFESLTVAECLRIASAIVNGLRSSGARRPSLYRRMRSRLSCTTRLDRKLSAVAKDWSAWSTGRRWSWQWRSRWNHGSCCSTMLESLGWVPGPFKTTHLIAAGVGLAFVVVFLSSLSSTTRGGDAI